jgi:hypothetical protein
MLVIRREGFGWQDDRFNQLDQGDLLKIFPVKQPIAIHVTYPEKSQVKNHYLASLLYERNIHVSLDC